MPSFKPRNEKARKLTTSQVIQIRESYDKGMTQGELSRAFSVSVGQIGRIVRGESWQTLPAAMARPEEVAESAERMFALQEQWKKEGLMKLQEEVLAAKGLEENSQPGSAAEADAVEFYLQHAGKRKEVPPNPLEEV